MLTKDNENNILTVTEAARVLYVSEAVIRNRLRSGQLCGIKGVGRTWLISRENVMELQTQLQELQAPMSDPA